MPDLAASIRELKQQIAGFKVPKELFVVASRPRNVMGKVQRNVLRDTFAKVFSEPRQPAP